MTEKLTPTAIRAIAKGQTINDHEVRGLQLKRGATGCSWLLYYRTKDGRERRPRIGTFPEMSLGAAREVAKKIKQRVATGEDPSGNWAEGRELPTVNDLCTRFIDVYCKARIKAGKMSTDHRDEYKQLIETYVRPGLGHMRVADVRTSNVEAFLLKVYNREFTTGVGTAPSAANHTRTLLKYLFNVARSKFEWRIQTVDGAPLNPVNATDKFDMVKRRRKIEPHEMHLIAKELGRLAVVYPARAACIWTILLTGARVSEVADAKAHEVQGRKLVKYDHKTKRYLGDKEIPLPSAAVDLLDRIQPEGDLLFGKFDLRRTWEDVRERAGCPDLQLLDLRRSFASFALDTGVPLDHVGSVLGHIDPRTTRGYTWLMEDTRAAVTQRVSERILELSAGASPVALPPPSE